MIDVDDDIFHPSKQLQPILREEWGRGGLGWLGMPSKESNTTFDAHARVELVDGGRPLPHKLDRARTRQFTNPGPWISQTSVQMGAKPSDPPTKVYPFGSKTNTL